VDAVTAEVHDAFAYAGIPAILLKGPAVADWLYPEAPLARRGGAGLALAYALRPPALLARLPRALWAIWRARRAGAR
jgi:hypothetical protein